jgi:feruloyl esterase
MPHCAGGNVPNVFGQPLSGAPPGDAAHDITTALDEWVRNGTAPGPIIATQYPGNDVTKPKLRDMPLCPYPQRVTFLGGPVEEARSYACR